MRKKNLFLNRNQFSPRQILLFMAYFILNTFLCPSGNSHPTSLDHKFKSIRLYRGDTWTRSVISESWVWSAETSFVLSRSLRSASSTCDVAFFASSAIFVQRSWDSAPFCNKFLKIWKFFHLKNPKAITIMMYRILVVQLNHQLAFH